MEPKEFIINWLNTYTGLNTQSIYDFARAIDRIYINKQNEALLKHGVMQGLPELENKLAQKTNYVKGYTVDPKFKGLTVPVIEFNEAIEIIREHFGSPTVADGADGKTVSVSEDYIKGHVDGFIDGVKTAQDIKNSAKP